MSTRQSAKNSEEVCIKVDGGAYSWGFEVKKEKSQNALSDRLELEEVMNVNLQEINLDLASNDMLIVVGKIGSGKTTLLHSLMDETVKIAGNQVVKGKIAYVEQDPFIFSSTIEDNITFGLKYNEASFNYAV